MFSFEIKNRIEIQPLFGPPKELLSDQGKEFLNQIVEAMLKLSRTEHFVTFAYSPNTNGLTERFNQTFVEAFILIN